MTTRPLPLLMFWVPPNATVAVRDGGRWLVVSHNSSDSMPIVWDAEGVFHFNAAGADAVRWSVASSQIRPANVEEVTGA